MERRKYTVQELVRNTSFVQWATGESKRETTEKWDRWVEKSEENRKIALRAQQIITNVKFTSLELPDLKQEWAKVHSDIKENKQLKILAERESVAQRKSKNWMNYYFKVAAVLLVGAFLGLGIYIYQEPESQEKQVVTKHIKTDYKEKKTINLSDGSTIMLAPGSKLSYKSNWLNQPVRKVRLNGEAYFSVAPQKTKDNPKLMVETEDGSASVWGTRFTVDTYGEGTQVVLEEGEVRVEVVNTDKTENIKRTIRPGEMALFSKGDMQVTLTTVNPTVYTSWTTNELYFDNTPFSVLVDRIERTYGVEVTIMNPEISSMKLSGSIDFRSLDGLINAVSEVMDITIKRSAETVIIVQNNKTGDL